ncbi:hypothetical protein GCM10018962_68710 [Dactylosporangium matsuzakiense]|uniref:Uncharacterized protein n=1 Tax=Dactylosporangium matsuzakiense TaxID=53360 RepID=A0A9W6KNS9_9ACTN|nr:hypothetical protein GCM10017581_071930 [Dactylosporangium matsuzakiense]
MSSAIDHQLVDDHVVRQRVAVRVLVVGRVVLDLRHRALALDALDVGRADLPGQIRVLAERLERPAPPRVAHDVDGRGEDHVCALAPLLGAQDLAVLPGQCGVEARRGGDRSRQLGDAGEPVAGADRAVLQPDLRDAEPGVGVDAAGEPAVGAAVQHGELLGLGHGGEHDGFAAAGRAARPVAPPDRGRASRVVSHGVTHA